MTSDTSAGPNLFDGYPDKRLWIAEMLEIKKVIKGRILELPEEIKIRFSPTPEKRDEKRDGALVFECAGEQTGD